MSLHRTLPLLLGTIGTILIGLPTMAQVPLVPSWNHTWPFGQGLTASMTFYPPSLDNHVVVDPVTGFIHCIISDEDSLFSFTNELLYSFDQTGIDLTTTPPPVIGVPVLAPHEDYYFALHMYQDLAIHNDTIAGSVGYGYSQSEHIQYTLYGPRNGPFQLTGLDKPYTWFGNAKSEVAAFAGGWLGSLDARVMCFDHYGHLIWLADAAGTIQDIVVKDGVVRTLTSGVLESRSLVDGSIVAPNITIADAKFMEVSNAHIYTAGGASLEGGVNVKKTTLTGTNVYTATIPSFGTYGQISGFAVDAQGRAWVTYNVDYSELPTEPLGGYLFGFDPNGSPLGTFTYGRRMNDVATDNGQLYITGQTNDQSFETYLLGADIDIITSTAEVAPAPAPSVWPIPTSERLNVQLQAKAQQLALVDAAGLIVRVWPTAPAGTSTLDVTGIAEGLYVLRVQEALRTTSTPVVIGR